MTQQKQTGHRLLNSFKQRQCASGIIIINIQDLDSFLLLTVLQRMRRNVDPTDMEGSGDDTPLFNGAGNTSYPS